MEKTTGISVQLWTSAEELQNAKTGGTTLLASKSPTDQFDIQISVVVEACDFGLGQVRVNVTRLQQAYEALGEMMADAFGAEIDKVLQE